MTDTDNNKQTNNILCKMNINKLNNIINAHSYVFDFSGYQTLPNIIYHLDFIKNHR